MKIKIIVITTVLFLCGIAYFTFAYTPKQVEELPPVEFTGESVNNTIAINQIDKRISSTTEILIGAINQNTRNIKAIEDFINNSIKENEENNTNREQNISEENQE